MSDVTVLILTPLSIEYKAVSRHLTDRESLVRDGAAYDIGRFKGLHHTYKVVLREPGMKNTDMALATERAIQHFDPQIAILCGIAGGIKDVQKGDVAIARSAFNYDSGKESDGFLPRPAEYHFSEDLLAYAQLVQRNDHWKKRCADGAPNAQVHIASVAAGDKVVAAVENATYERITQFLSHCKFLEMEAAGFGLAVLRHRNIHALVVRGISDMCKGKGETDREEEGWQDRAADRAAGVAMEMLWQAKDLSFVPSTTTSAMSAQALAQQVYELVIPSLVQNTPLSKDQQAIWKQVEPLCGSALEKLKKSPDNADRQAGVRIAVEDGLEENEVMKRNVERMILKQMGKFVGTAVVGKNVVVGSSIRAGGNVKIGDDINNNTTTGIHDLKNAHNLSTHNDISKCISTGKIEEGVDKFLEYTVIYPNFKELYAEGLLLSARLNELKTKIRMGIMRNDEANIERNQITANFLNLLDALAQGFKNIK